MSKEYKEGFLDGFKIGLEEGKKLNENKSLLSWQEECDWGSSYYGEVDPLGNEMCPKCGSTTTVGKCNSPFCPVKVVPL